ncbi:hypothetical protein [Tropicimonas sp. IMCC34043]|uniref:hypothetical protein n=1 Tax=Tropicimonas sp. IMCC34043 TaxID=2248760 RepID=UPI000E2482AD|nr:hypothetical protein [Tropicimonas sp. IMCC34043]
MSDFGTLLAGAEAARTRPLESAAAVARALAAAPEDPEVRLAAYRFYFYSHDYVAAGPQAEAILVHAARRLNIATDWRAVAPGDAPFKAHEFAPGLYLQALVAIGYCAARRGELTLARAALGKAAELDPTDRFGGAALLGAVEAVADDAAP